MKCLKIPATTSQDSHNGLLKRLISGVLLLNVFVGGIVWYSLQNSKTHYENQAAVTSRNISRVLDENISGIFAKVAVALQSVSDEAERLLTEGVIQQETLNRFIIQEHARLPELLSFRATNASGDAIYGPEEKIATTISLAHRDYFKFLRDHPNAGMVISKPLVGGISGKWMVVMAHSIHDPNGTFAGLAYAGLGIEYLMQTFKELNMGLSGTITLLDEALFLVARYPGPETAGAEIGQKFGSPQLLDLIESGNTSATYTAISSVDGIERIFSYRRLSTRQPFYIITGLAPRDYLTGWFAEVYKLSLFWAAFFVCTFISTWLFYREWNRTRKAEKEVSKSEQRFRSFIENANELIYTLSPDGIITYVAPSVEFLLGYLPAELIGTSFDTLVHPQEVLSFKSALGRIMETGIKQKRIEYQIRHKNGTWIWFISNASVVMDTISGNPAFFGIGLDITYRKRAENALHILNEELERRVLERTKSAENANRVLQTIIECMSDWAWDVDTEWRYTFCTPKVEDYLGYKPEEMIGKHVYDFMQDEEAIQVRCKFIELANAKLQIKNLENWCITKDGRQVLFSTNAVPILDENGRLVGYRGVDTDLTARKLAEEALHRSNETLELRIQERSMELEKLHAQMAVQDKMASVGQLAAGIAHELNNPMSFVSVNFITLSEYFVDIVDMLQIYRKLADTIDTSLPESQLVRHKEAELKIDFILEDIPILFKESGRGFERIDRIIQSMRDFSRMDQTGDFSTFNINACIEDTLVIARNEYKYIADVTADLGDLPAIRCLPEQLNQVFLNLIVNSAHAIKSQDRQERGRITIRTRHDETNVYCEISDDGPGVPADIRNRIFDPFFTTKPPGQGTGLGLSICYDIIVEKHQGTLSVHCPETGGTVFSIRISKNL